MAASEADSREKLAEDVLRFVREITDEALVMGAHEASWYPNIGGLRECIADYLDRQAAITRAEVFADGEFDCMTCGAKRELQERVDSLTADVKKWADAANEQRLVAMEQADKVQELTAERDELRKECSRWHVEQVHAYGNWEDVHEYAKKLEAERDELRDKLSEKQHVCDVQRDSFFAMERERAELSRLALGLWRRMDALRLAGCAPSLGDVAEMAARLAQHGIEAS